MLKFTALSIMAIGMIGLAASLQISGNESRRERDELNVACHNMRQK